MPSLWVLENAPLSRLCGISCAYPIPFRGHPGPESTMLEHEAQQLTPGGKPVPPHYFAGGSVAMNSFISRRTSASWDWKT